MVLSVLEMLKVISANDVLLFNGSEIKVFAREGKRVAVFKKAGLLLIPS